MALLCIAPPLVEPVSLPELKQMLRIDLGDISQDDVLITLAGAARTMCETITQRRFVQQTWRLYMDYFPGYIDLKLSGQKVSAPFVSGSNAVLVGIRYAIVLPFPPVQSLVAFNYQNADGVVTDMFNGQPGNPADWSFVQDLQSQPARLTPPFGEMWPVARVVVNAVQLDYQVGYATPVTVTTATDSPQLSGATFASSNVGQPISIPGAGAYGGALNTVIQSVSSGVATLRDAPLSAVTNATSLLVNYGTPGHWELIRAAIKSLVNAWFVNRLPNNDPKSDAMRAVSMLLGPVMDKRY